MVISQYFHISRARLALQRCGVSSIATAHARYHDPRDLPGFAGAWPVEQQGASASTGVLCSLARLFY